MRILVRLSIKPRVKRDANQKVKYRLKADGRYPFTEGRTSGTSEMIFIYLVHFPERGFPGILLVSGIAAWIDYIHYGHDENKNTIFLFWTK